MTRMIVLTFGFLGWALYEMSGGSSFEPGSNSLTILASVDAETLPAAVEPKPEPAPIVARADTTATPLTTVAPVVTVDVSLVAEPAPIVEAEEAKLASLTGIELMNNVTPEPVAVVVPEVDYRAVTGNRVNVRNGPGTDFSVVTQLRRGDEVEVLSDDGLGWVKLRSLEGNRVGWMSGSFLQSLNY
ncbi:MAG: SH3 domain-containing protein [Paracoccaceae bacterium]|nr:SH3 domain-containing protein [Paracoccaceae bacterium]